MAPQSNKLHEYIVHIVSENKIVDILYSFIKNSIESVSFIIKRLRYIICGTKVSDLKQIPIIINNYNRLEYLKLLIESLEIRGYTNIHILDNKSKYPPLLEYYKTCKYDVIYLDENLGYCALWKSKVFNDFRKGYYVYTDSDMQIDPGCPDNFMEEFMSIMNNEFFAQKVGFSLRIDDLPDLFMNKFNVIDWEKQYWIPLGYTDRYFRAPIDTTFALYRPYCYGPSVSYKKMYRTNFPYVIKHLPWYVDTDNLGNEELFYINSITQSTHWSKQSKINQ